MARRYPIPFSWVGQNTTMCKDRWIPPLIATQLIRAILEKVTCEGRTDTIILDSLPLPKSDLIVETVSALSHGTWKQGQA